MGTTAQRQEARRRAREARSSQEQERKSREKRLEDLAVTVQVEVGEAAERERRAGDALRAMTDDEGLSLREAILWCGDIALRDAARLRRLAGEVNVSPSDGDRRMGSMIDETRSGSDSSLRRPST